MNFSAPTVIKLFALAAIVGLAGIASTALADSDEHAGHNHASNDKATPSAPQAAKAKATTSGDPYTLDTCPVTGEELGSMGDPVIYDYNGREVRFCCQGCVADFESNPDKYIAKIDAQVIAQQKDYYALDTCPVTGEPLDSMGGVVDYVYNNRLVRFCCSGCIAEFESNPDEYLAKLDAAAIASQTPDYPLDHCLVLTDEKIGGEDTVDYVVAGRLFRLCCNGCRDTIASDPAQWIAALDEARN